MVKFSYWMGWNWQMKTKNVWKLLKMSHLNFWILTFPSIFVLLKVTCLVTLFTSKLQVLKNSPNGPFLALLNKLLATQILKLASLAMLNATFSHLFIWFSNTLLIFGLSKIQKWGISEFFLRRDVKIASWQLVENEWMGRSCSKRSQDFVFRQALQCLMPEKERVPRCCRVPRLTNGAPISVQVWHWRDPTMSSS